MIGIGVPRMTAQRSAIPQTQQFLLTGVTLDVAGAILGSCRVCVFRSGAPGMACVYVGETISNSVGAWELEVSGDPTATYFANFYKTGSPDVFSTTVNTLVGTVT